MHWPAQALADGGWDITYLGVGSTVTDFDLQPSDVVRIHATNNVSGHLAELVDYLRHVGKVYRIVLDFDDDYLALEDIQDVSGWWWRDMRSDIAAAIGKADALTVATPPLRTSYERFGTPIHVVRNYMPERLLVGPVPWSARYARIGWMGMVGRAGAGIEADPHGNLFEMPDPGQPHRADLLGVADALRDRGLWAVGDPDEVAKLLPDSFVSGVGRATPERPPGDHRWHGAESPNLYDRMATCRAAITPLVEHRFNAGKSWIKAVEYAWAGVPVVMPAWHPGYDELVASGVPGRMYRDVDEAREALDMILGLEREQWERLSRDTRAQAVNVAGMEYGASVWEHVLWQIVS